MEITGMTAAARRLLSDSKKRTGIMIFLAAAAVLLLLLSGRPDSTDIEPLRQENTAAEYAVQLEERMEQIISSVKGAGQCRVLITLQNSGEYIYASEDTVSTDSSESTDPGGRQSVGQREDHQSSHIIIDTGQGEQALVRTELMPSVSGVVVVCPGAEDPQVAQRIMSVVTTALDISPKRVCITQSSQ